MKRKQGFTLVELMIVVLIIGILSSVFIFNILRAMTKGRDAMRIKHMDTYVTVLQMYTLNEDEYPEGDNSGVHLDLDCDSNVKDVLLDGGYLGNFPTDPFGQDTDCDDDSDGAFFYGWDSDHTCDGSKYCISINRLETDAFEDLLIQKFGQMKSTTCGGDANIDDADFNYCFN